MATKPPTRIAFHSGKLRMQTAKWASHLQHMDFKTPKLGIHQQKCFGDEAHLIESEIRKTVSLHLHIGHIYIISPLDFLAGLPSCFL